MTARQKLPATKSIYIREWRKHRGMSGTDLANEIGISKCAISRWETGSSDIKISTIRTIARALGTEPWQLLYGPPASSDLLTTSFIGGQAAALEPAEVAS